jgi:eukaryotic-like serine/threonine-protein kinase
VEAAGLFEHQDALARRIVQSLRLPLTPAEARQLQRDVPATPRAYELYLRANQLSVRAGDWAAARDLYVARLEEDPNYAPAWARLGRCWRLIGNYTSDPAAQRRAFTEAESALRRALQLNPELAIATSLYAQFEISSGRSAEALRRLLERVRTHGADAVTMAALVHACRFCGLLHESVMAHDVARRLDPHVPTSVAHTWFMLGEYERARDTCDAADIGYLNAIALVALGRKREAVEWLLARPSVHDVDGSGVYLASLLAVLQGDRATAVVATQRALRAVTDGEAIFYMVRQLAHLGEHAAALEQLRRVVDSGFTPVFALEHDPWLRPVAAAPGFSAILHDAKERRAAAAMLIDQQGSTVLQAGSAKRDTDRERTPTAPHQAG